MQIRILGITGTFQSGKDAVAALIGWKKYSCSDLLRDECKLRGLSIDINQNLVDIGDDLRSKFGSGVLGKMAVEKINSDLVDKAIVVSIRTPEELIELKRAKNFDFKLLVLDAPIEVRFARAKASPRWVDMSFSDFKAQEDSQLQGIGPFMNLLKVFKFADAKILNTFNSFDELKSAVNAVLKGWGWL